MAVYTSSAVFNAVDNISNVVDNIGTNVARMGDRVQQQMLSSAQASSGLERALGTLGAAGFGVLAGVVAGGIQNFFDLNGAMVGVATRTGMTGEALEQFKKQTEDAFANQGLVTNIGDMARAIEAVKTKTQNLNDADLTKFTNEVIAAAQAWGLSPESLVDQIGKVQAKFEDLKTSSPEKTLDLLIKLAQDTGDPLNEVAQNAEKIGSKLAGAGLTGTAAIGLLDLAAQGGVTKFTDLTNAVQTFHDKLAKPTWAVQQALKDLGLNTLAKDVQTNKVTYEQALDMVFNKLSKVEDPAKRAKDAVTLFGKSVTNLGGPDVLAGLAGFTTKMDDAQGAAERATKSMNDSFGNFISTTWNQFTTGVSTGVDQVYSALKNADWAGAAKIVVDAANAILQTLIDKINEVMGSLDHAGQRAGDWLSGKTLPDQGMGQVGTTGGGHAWGGSLGEGLNIVGEQGPEAIWKRGSSAQVFTAQETKHILGSGAGGTGGTVIHLSVGTLVGTGGMQELARILVPYQQRETARRSTGE